ncbi:hypothetical protein Trydic_g5824 [Trypoxylus dichotomus]
MNSLEQLNEKKVVGTVRSCFYVVGSVVVCIWWYRLQLIQLSRALRGKRPQYKQMHEKIILQRDNARLYVAKPVKIYLETLKCEVLPHAPYSQDIAPSDYHLFPSTAHGLADQQLRSYEEKWFDSWITSKYEHFYRNGVRCLPER